MTDEKTKTANNHDHLGEPALRYARQDFPIIRDRLTVGEALNVIRREGVGERIIYFYVTDNDGQLKGIIPTRRLLTSSPQRPVSDVMITDVITIPHDATVQEACEMFVIHKLFAFPIVDAGNRVLAVIDIGFFSEETISVSERRKIENVFELIGFGMSQLQGRSLIGVLRYRLPWLLAIVASGLFCAVILNAFQVTLSQNLIVVFFLVFALGVSDAVAAQTMTVVLQSLHFTGPSWRSYGNWLRNELAGSLLLGVICGGLGGAVALLWTTPVAGLAIGVGIFIAIVISAALAVTTPTLLYATHENSKIAAGPVTHGITLITTALIYLGCARIVLG